MVEAIGDLPTILEEIDHTQFPEVEQVGKKDGCCIVDKKFAMEIVETTRRTKQSASITGKNNHMYGKTHSKETRAKISAALKGRFTGENHPSFGKTHSEESKAKMSEAVKKRMQDPEVRKRLSESGMGSKSSEETKRKISESLKGHRHTKSSRRKISEAMRSRIISEETRAKMSTAATGRALSEETRAKMSGENNHRWKGGISFEPYCILFNFDKKEEVRNRDERRCQLCGKSEILNGERLSVHHIDNSKTQGCSGEKWYLCALCRSCNAKSDTIEKEFLIVSNLNKIQGFKT